jgi:chemotaxis signal transduction protein
VIKDILLKKSKGETEEEQKKYYKFILCKIDDYEFLIDILFVKEIVNPLEITSVPGTNEFILGVLNLRGLVVPIVRIQLENEVFKKHVTELTRYVICEIEKEFIGLFVDESQFIVDIEEEILNQFESDLDNLFYKIVKYEDRNIGILNLKKVFNDYKIKN